MLLDFRFLSVPFEIYRHVPQFSEPNDRLELDSYVITVNSEKYFIQHRSIENEVSWHDWIP